MTAQLEPRRQSNDVDRKWPVVMGRARRWSDSPGQRHTPIELAPQMLPLRHTAPVRFADPKFAPVVRVPREVDAFKHSAFKVHLLRSALRIVVPEKLVPRKSSNRRSEFRRSLLCEPCIQDVGATIPGVAEVTEVDVRRGPPRTAHRRALEVHPVARCTIEGGTRRSAPLKFALKI